MNYRPEIDGLRALGLLAVIFAHAGFAAFDGGYIGVDIFFVISGYLITKVILREYAEGRFSIGRFYARRVRRILPALFFVLLCTIPFAWMWLLPDAYEQFSKSLMAATLSFSNIYFLRNTGYFSPETAEVPLIHTWSLGLEEQFYLLFPLLFLFRLKIRTIFSIVLALALGSLLLSEAGSRFFPVSNYYLLPTRVWEILLGSICAFQVFGKDRRTSDVLAAAGLSLVILSIFLFDPSLNIPSLVALLPTGGTALILLFASQTSIIGRILAIPPLVWLGRISFSAYLWHQPVFAFWRIRSPEPPSTIVMCALIALVLLLSALSWYFVEQPFRGQRVRFAKLAYAACALAVGLVGFGAWGDVKEGLPSRLPNNVREFVDRTTWNDNCLFQREDGIPALPSMECMFNIGSGRTIAVWGDSIGASISPALQEEFKRRNIGMVQLTHGFCAPILGVSVARDEGAANCEEFNRRALDYLAASNVETVILSASWVSFLTAPYMEIDSETYANGAIPLQAIADNLRETVQRLEATGKQVVIVYPAPRFGKPVVDLMASRMLRGDPAPSFEFSKADFEANTGRAYQLLNSGLPQDVSKVLPEQLFCDPTSKGGCYFGLDGVAYIADRGHYTRAGAERIAAAVADELFGADGITGSIPLPLN